MLALIRGSLDLLKEVTGVLALSLIEGLLDFAVRDDEACWFIPRARLKGLIESTLMAASEPDTVLVKPTSDRTCTDRAQIIYQVQMVYRSCTDHLQIT